jgi:preprotein translocase subunit SecG
LASLGGGTTDLVVGGRQAANLLTRASWWCGGVFLGLSLLLAVVSSNRQEGLTEVQERLRQQAVPTTTEPVLPGPTTPSTETPTPPAGTTGAPAPGATQAPAPSTTPAPAQPATPKPKQQ